MKKERPKLFITMGFPGSGKTHFAERFSKEDRVVHLSSDFFRSYIFPNARKSTPEENVTVFGLLDGLAAHILKSGISVIIDTNVTLRFYRKRYAKMARSAGADCYTLYFKTPIPIAEKRLQSRLTKHPIKSRFYRDIAVHVLHDLRLETEEPYKNEKIIFIDGTREFKQSLKELRRQIKKYENKL